MVIDDRRYEIIKMLCAVRGFVWASCFWLCIGIVAASYDYENYHRKPTQQEPTK